MRHVFLSMLLSVVFLVSVVCEWWSAAIITIIVLLGYFVVRTFFYLCRHWPDHSWPDNA